MPPVEETDRYQTAVLWEATGTVDKAGQPLLSLPVELTVRWDDVQRKRLDRQGNTTGSDAEVVLDREVALDSLMWKGRLDEWYGSTGTSAGNATGLHVVTDFDATPDVKGRFVRRVAKLKRFRGKLPTQGE